MDQIYPKINILFLSAAPVAMKIPIGSTSTFAPCWFGHINAYSVTN